MSCLCTSTTLRLFLRNVAQVDLPVALRWPISTHHSKTTIRKLQAARDESVSKINHAGKNLSSNKYANLCRELDQSDAVVDFSPESIDTLAEELQSRQGEALEYDRVEEPSMSQADQKGRGYVTPLQDILTDLPKRKELVSKMRWRSIMDESDSPPVASRSRLKLKLSKPQESKADDDWKPPEREPWMIEKERVKEKYPDGYQPLKKLSPDAIAGIRALHAQMPDKFPTFSLAQEFKVSPEAIRRILKSKWRPNTEEELDRERRWLKRGEQIWGRWADQGAVPPARWRSIGVGTGMKALRRRASRSEYTPYTPDPPPQLVTTKVPINGEDRMGTGSRGFGSGIL